eukprot:GHVR01183116.1.p1 GENE.GHVR01183116.1~~GHVR01183116.1.p1  ORF type:complete len:122 (+),score=0.46 GHVR01183116.1:1809-2174(+)
MLTTASLVLKKMPDDNLKAKLQKFILRFNNEYLNNLKHSIIIPFRKTKSNQISNPNYIVGIVPDDCNCFPTRKRVPYRIILETIDSNDLMSYKPLEKFYNANKISPDLERDLFNEVNEIVN